MAKHVQDIHDTIVIPFPGINISRLTTKISKGWVDLKSDYVILHVGTNDITGILSVEEILSSYNDLISIVKKNGSCKILMSAVLPRPIDFEISDDKVKSLNHGLMKLCESRHVRFLKTFKPFLYYGKPRRELFTVRDGLHLNFEGVRRLREFFVNTIAHLD